MRRILVAGATGYLGSYVVRELGRRGYFVRALVRSPDRLDASTREPADEVVEAQVTCPETLGHVCDDVGTRDAVGPATGSRQLSDHFAALAADGGGRHD